VLRKVSNVRILELPVYERKRIGKGLFFDKYEETNKIESWTVFRDFFQRGEGIPLKPLTFVVRAFLNRPHRGTGRLQAARQSSIQPVQVAS
jgi:hypothetical protein